MRQKFYRGLSDAVVSAQPCDKKITDLGLIAATT